MTNRRFDRLMGGPPRKPESALTERDMDLARSVQEVTEEAMLRAARHVHETTGQKCLCLAGGVALNCVANGRILREGPFDDLWIQPAAGDAGGAIGAALTAWYRVLDNPRPGPTSSTANGDHMQAALLGPSWDQRAVEQFLERKDLTAVHFGDDELADHVADLMIDGRVVGWHQGRMEFGPRALGARSILADPRRRDMQSKLNLKIKFRESFRPFAPSVLRENVAEYFELDHDSPYMLLVAPVRRERRVVPSGDQAKLRGTDKLTVARSDLPAITHVDYSARVQTVRQEENPPYFALLKAFERKTGCAVLINTSFNVRGEPIVCTPEDAFRCFMRTDMDHLVLGNYVLDKNDQDRIPDAMADWRKDLPLD
jgi:carbamoyltransferase